MMMDGRKAERKRQRGKHVDQTLVCLSLELRLQRGYKDKESITDEGGRRKA